MDRSSIHEKLAEISELEEHVETLAHEISQRTHIFQELIHAIKATLPMALQTSKPVTRNAPVDPLELLALPNSDVEYWKAACGEYLGGVSGQLATMIFMLQMKHLEAEMALKNKTRVFDDSFSKAQIRRAALEVYREPSILQLRLDVLSASESRAEVVSKAATKSENKAPRFEDLAWKELWLLVSMAIVVLQAKYQHTLPYDQQDQEVIDNANEACHFGTILQDSTRFRLQPPSPQELSWFSVGYGISYYSPALRWYSSIFHSALELHYGVQEITSHAGGKAPPDAEYRFYQHFTRFRDSVEDWCSKELENRDSDLEEHITNDPSLMRLYHNMYDFYVGTAIPWHNQQRSRNRYVYGEPTCA